MCGCAICCLHAVWPTWFSYPNNVNCSVPRIKRIIIYYFCFRITETFILTQGNRNKLQIYILLTPLSRALWKLQVRQQVQTFPAFHASQQFILLFPRGCHLSRSWTRWIHSYVVPSHLRAIVISHIYYMFRFIYFTLVFIYILVAFQEGLCGIRVGVGRKQCLNFMSC